MDADAWAAIATGAGAVVSLGAAGIAIWQASVARAAKDATVDQAATARAALELQRADRDLRDAPDFSLEIVPATENYTAHVEVKMLAGPHGITASVTYVNGWARRAPDRIERRETQGGTVQPRQMVKGTTVHYTHNAPLDAAAIWTMAIITSHDVDCDRKWEWVRRRDWASPENPL